MSKLLLLEDDISLVDGLGYSLEKNGFEWEVARTVKEALHCLQRGDRYDLLLLDVTLHDGTGYEVCEAVRKRGDSTPIIFLTASDEEVSIIRGLDCGGDDYITKPFRLGELCSRIRALLRRAGMPSGEGMSDKEKENVILCGGLRIDLFASRVLLDGRPVDLTGAEYRLLCLLARNAGRTVTRERILQELWDDGGNYVDDNTVSVYVRRLREKLEKDPSHPKHLFTVRGFGYQWKEEG